MRWCPGVFLGKFVMFTQSSTAILLWLGTFVVGLTYIPAILRSANNGSVGSGSAAISGYSLVLLTAIASVALVAFLPALVVLADQLPLLCAGLLLACVVGIVSRVRRRRIRAAAVWLVFGAFPFLFSGAPGELLGLGYFLVQVNWHALVVMLFLVPIAHILTSSFGPGRAVLSWRAWQFVHLSPFVVLLVTVSANLFGWRGLPWEWLYPNFYVQQLLPSATPVDPSAPGSHQVLTLSVVACLWFLVAVIFWPAVTVSRLFARIRATAVAHPSLLLTARVRTLVRQLEVERRKAAPSLKAVIPEYGVGAHVDVLNDWLWCPSRHGEADGLREEDSVRLLALEWAYANRSSRVVLVLERAALVLFPLTLVWWTRRWMAHQARLIADEDVVRSGVASNSEVAESLHRTAQALREEEARTHKRPRWADPDLLVVRASRVLEIHPEGESRVLWPVRVLGPAAAAMLPVVLVPLLSRPVPLLDAVTSYLPSLPRISVRAGEPSQRFAFPASGVRWTELDPLRHASGPGELSSVLRRYGAVHGGPFVSGSLHSRPRIKWDAVTNTVRVTGGSGFGLNGAAVADAFEDLLRNDPVALTDYRVQSWLADLRINPTPVSRHPVPPAVWNRLASRFPGMPGGGRLPWIQTGGAPYTGFEHRGPLIQPWGVSAFGGTGGFPRSPEQHLRPSYGSPRPGAVTPPDGWGRSTWGSSTPGVPGVGASQGSGLGRPPYGFGTSQGSGLGRPPYGFGTSRGSGLGRPPSGAGRSGRTW